MESEGLSVRTFLDEVRSIKCCEIILPTSAGREIELQCVARPDQAQRILLDRLGLTIPSRLSRPKWRGLAKTDSSYRPFILDFCASRAEVATATMAELLRTT